MPIECGALLAFSSPVTGAYLSTKSGTGGVDVIPVNSNQGPASQWILQCEKGPFWNDGDGIVLKNIKHKCYLQTNFTDRTSDVPNKYLVTCGPMSKWAIWKAAEGIYFPPEEGDEKSETELENSERDL
jgi:hypothetical protein